jgi:hypothetical protein
MIPWGDDTFNVSYKQLPVIGSVVNYTYDSGTNEITGMTLHVNFAQFSRKLQFEYPAVGLKAYTVTEGVLPEGNTDVIRHGLFADFGVPHVEVSMWGYTDVNPDTGSAEGEAMHVWPGYDSYIGAAADKRTEVEIVSDTSFYYKILGEVSYNS